MHVQTNIKYKIGYNIFNTDR